MELVLGVTHLDHNLSAQPWDYQLLLQKGPLLCINVEGYHTWTLN